MNQPVQQPQRPQMHPATAQALAVLTQRIAGNPKTRDRLLNLVKEVDPSYRLPGDVEVRALKAELKAERDEEKRKEAEERAINRRKSQRSKLVQTHGEEVVKQIEEGILKKYPHLEYEDAAKLHAADKDPVRPTGHREIKPGKIWEFPTLPGLLENPEKAAADAAYAVIDELRGRA